MHRQVAAAALGESDLVTDFVEQTSVLARAEEEVPVALDVAQAQARPAQFAEGYFDIPDGVYEPAAKFTTRRNNMETIRASNPGVAEAAE